MPEPLAYLNGRLIAASQAVVSVEDAGFVLGVTVAEQLRTFHGQLFRVNDHLRRLRRSLEIVGVRPEAPLDEIGHMAFELAEYNHRLLSAGDDLGLTIVVTPGRYAAYGGKTEGTVCIHTYPLPFSQWADKYARGQSLVTTSVEQVSPRCWPPEVKGRSRMHYYLADQQAAQREPGARAVLLSAEGFITETATANVLAYDNVEGLVSPPQDTILPGISLTVVRELANQLDIPFSHRQLTPHDLAVADEVLLTSTPHCLLPVTRFNGRAVGSGEPGTAFRRLLDTWSQLVGLDIAAQAAQVATR
jgi:branched-subunit amino acid aminotransferase/4-amino-4-deoxychorismate lyase